MVQRIVGHRQPIPRSAAIYQDLKSTGDDAYELFEMISARFGISFQGFDWPAYFPNDTELGPLSFWATYRAAKFDPIDTTRPAITIGHLLTVIERGAWFEPASSK
jgi:hypothetical protein